MEYKRITADELQGTTTHKETREEILQTKARLQRGLDATNAKLAILDAE